MRPEDFRIIDFLLETDDPLLAKRGLQTLCDKLESGISLAADQRLKILRLVATHRRSADFLVRRWIYKAIGLLRDRNHVPYLLGQFKSGENDIENLSWIVAALAVLIPFGELV